MIVLIYLLSIVNGIDFNTWVGKYNKHFTAVEMLRRNAIFNMNGKIVGEFNKEGTFKLSLEGPFAAMTNEEYKNILKSKRSEEGKGKVKYLNIEAPETVDWRKEGKVTPIRDQAECGGCYAFGSIAALEGRLLVEQGGDANTLDLSEEEMIQCTREYGNNGCGGGFGSNAYDYIIEHGVSNETEYPFTGMDSECKTNIKPYVTMKGYNRVARNNVKELKSAISQGMVDVAMDASFVKFQLYKSGAYTDKKCKKSFFALNHEVSAVGYGVVDGIECWIIRNSWGTTWGENGYFNIAIEGNTCGIATDPLYPTGAQYL
ncbi:cysteine protease 8, putative [Entamoeba histolytica HM-3:IMSS]|uniref:Cysteine protease, putative n=2 Tax=Entamoeba histolytica TaxID=5759 RepID=M2SC39_ENTHI|nr:cysteine protease, putative [Entamoeba histolytica KU27]EMS14026.1 cysteine protease 8, putative [Entamoeba histolytica HM-3:IMSS]